MTFSFSKEFSKNAYTGVENVFITEYLKIASGDAVKVYLYGLFLCRNQGGEISLKEFAENVNLTENEVKDVFSYWEEFGLVTVLSVEPLNVEYLPVSSSFSSKPRKFKAEKYADFTKGVQSLISARMIPTNEYTEYFSIMETYGIKPEAMLLIIKYCVSLKGEDIGYKYISKVAKDFGNRDINTIEKVEEELSSYNLRTGEIVNVLKALSSKRKPEIEDLNLFKKWTRELNFEPENIVFAASKIKKGSMNKLDEFLMELFAMKSFSKEEIKDYIENKEKIYQLAVKINRALSVYMEVIDTVVDTYTKKWLSYGYQEETLLFIASKCFKSGNNNLPFMDELIEKLYSLGYIDFTSVNDYFEDIKKTDEFIKKMLIISGTSRHPNDWDRKTVDTWKNWGFSEDMILEAAGLASGKSSPIPYMNGILSNWKRDGVFTISQTEKTKDAVESIADYNLEYDRRRKLALSKANKNLENAMEIEGFGEIYSRLNGLEKDLAFAEIAKNDSLLKNLETEKSILTVNAENLLKTAGLSLSDLSPKYACEKCKDTGYVGTNRCDCFDKKPN